MLQETGGMLIQHCTTPEDLQKEAMLKKVYFIKKFPQNICGWEIQKQKTEL